MISKTMIRALYDFEGDPDNGELSFRAGDSLTLVTQDIGEGWWEAKNDLGHQGLIPESYVQITEQPEPSFPPPPPPMVTGVDPRLSQYSSTTTDSDGTYTNGYNEQDPGPGGGVQNDDWGYTGPQQSNNFDNKASGGTIQQQQSYDEWDDDWDDEDDQSSTSTAGHQDNLGGSGNFGLAAPRREHKQLSPNSDISKYGTVKKSFNRFSNFAKSGGEAFLMGQATAKVSESDQISIIDSEDGPQWESPSDCYTCAIKSPKKESKLKGLKSFIAYQLTPSFSNIQVSRRYKHFDWLHERLEEKFTCIPVPPLPDKAISGRYEDDFINERMKQLQYWVDRMVRHPVISKSDVFLHFLTCTDEKKWKQGKRKAEKDEFLGAFKREYQKIGESFKQLAQTFNLDTTSSSRELTAAIDYTGDTYNNIGNMFEQQPKEDIDPLMDTLFEYKGILSTYPDILTFHEGAIGKAKECLKLQSENKMTESEVQTSLQRADVISYGTLAEVNHFQKSRVEDFKGVMQTYLRGQIKFYKEITEKLEKTLERVEKA
ncbi:hypothetical protein KUTeg_023224 [Tegillarca granosa]|uniref:Sorting nexin n=1 Tax=Tegillarca granosa TaxID=220873 RepID=A0ABQ9E112_TEGGR|nr:hypothetical protein KUTeg_023224 [Tegillarca granosa]